ncbi:MAG: type II toxin-antitoxin system PemK/MazF family toxin [Ilumatobacteraceae bacterium]
MRRSPLIDRIVRAGRSMVEAARKATPRRSTPRSGSPGRAPRPPEPPARDIDARGLTVEYSPCMDGDPDPGEVVWTWVPYEDDPRQGKDRPVVIVGRRGDNLAGVALTSKQRDNEEQVPVGTGPWDREGRPSYAKVERLLEVDPGQVRREGAVLARDRFDAVVAGVRRTGG